MDDSGLRRCLRDELSPDDWYGILNERVFFWLSHSRLIRLLSARPYRHKEHDVLELDARSLVAAHRNNITLSPINSGATKPFPRERGQDTFLSIADYPYSSWRARRRPGERAVELAVMGGVPDVRRFVRQVSVMRGEEVIKTESVP